MADDIWRDELEAAHCWEAEDRVPGRPEMTAFRREVRLHHARWREAHGHPIGSQPMRPQRGKPSRPVGSRLPVDYALETGATFLTPHALAAARARMATKEPRQSLDQQRMWADLLWPTALAINLFGDLAADLALADQAVHTWWPDAPGTVSAVRFEHSPGWLDMAYLGNLSSHEAVFELDLGGGERGVLAVTVHNHDRVKREIPKPIRLPHYRRIAEASGAFMPDYLDAVNGTDLVMVWLRHLLVHSMLQHERGPWRWGRLVVVHPAGNTDQSDAAARYRGVLVDDDESFATITLEDLLDAGALPKKTTKALRERYVVAGAVAQPTRESAIPK